MGDVRVLWCVSVLKIHGGEKQPTAYHLKTASTCMEFGEVGSGSA